MTTCTRRAGLLRGTASLLCTALLLCTGGVLGPARPALAQPAPVLQLPEARGYRLEDPRQGRQWADPQPFLYGGAGWDALPARPHRPGARKAAAAAPAVADTLLFNTPRPVDGRWEARPFVLAAEGPGFRLWVDLAEGDAGHVTEADVAALAEALGSRTPPGSVDPEAGILANNVAAFGPLPNTDGDGVLDVLWLDLQERAGRPGRRRSGPPLAGLLAPEDYMAQPDPGRGNARDVIYLDTAPTLTAPAYGMEVVQQEAAALIQQLIHFGYDPQERPFFVAGLAEYAKVLNGYAGRGTAYLQDLLEHQAALFSWGEYEGDLPRSEWRAFAGDLQRAALFTAYLAEQVGPDLPRRLTQHAEVGTFAYLAVLDSLGFGRSVEDLMLDFHTANYVNDPDLDARFGYRHPAYRHARALPSRMEDGAMKQQTPFADFFLKSGAVQYLAWDNVDTFRFVLDVIYDVQRPLLRIRAVLEDLAGNVTVQDVAPTREPATFPGPYARVTLLVTVVDPWYTYSDARIGYAAEWDGPAEPTVTTAYDDGMAAPEDSIPNFILINRDGWRQATRFVVPEGTRLSRVYVAPFFQNQFVGFSGEPLGTREDPRDFTLHVWASDGAGRPGEELYRGVYADYRPFFMVSGDELRHFSIDLPEDSLFASLPDTVFIGLSDAGTDANRLMLAYALYADENVSFVSPPASGEEPVWHPLWDVTLGGARLVQRAIPLRAQFRPRIPMAVAAEPVPEAPAAALHPNYPNPFYPRTEIRYTLAQAAPVRLCVYDVLGRRQAVLVDALQPAGTHTVTLEAAGWASGPYLYRLETPHRTEARLMILAK